MDVGTVEPNRAAGIVNDPTAWIPCSGLECIEEMVWIPRLLQKARRHEAGRQSGRDLMNGYMYGDNDFIDRRVLTFLRTDDAAVSAIVRAEPDDAVAARSLVEHSGRTVEERRAYSARLRRQLFDFVLLEADEGRLPPGPKRTIVRLVYNRLVMPVIAPLFRRAERKRRHAS
jgi:hypothetical protein